MSNRKYSWAVLIGESLHQRILLARIVPGISPLSLPGEHATDGDIVDAEKRLGFALDAQHAAILREGNGWLDALGDGDLLSTFELGQGERWEKAQEILDLHYRENSDGSLPARESIYPFILMDSDEQSVFVLDRAAEADPVDGAPVYLIGDGAVIEDWPSLYEFWVAEIAMLRKLISDYQQKRDAGQLPYYLTQA